MYCVFLYISVKFQAISLNFERFMAVDPHCPLLDLCRQCINNILNNKTDKVESLLISNAMKKYL